jgi:LysR family transcriptional regulator, transcription activator of glutamate synthase operon
VELDYLRDFVKIAHLGSISRAAEASNVTQPAMSRILSVVEDEIGVRLFDRENRSLHLNPSGAVVLQAVIESLSILDNACERVRGLAKVPSGVLKVAVVSLHPNVPLFIADFSRKFPEIRIDAFPVEDESVLNPSACDLCFISAPISNPALVFERAFSEPLRLVIAKDHPLASRRSVGLAELSHYEFVCSDRRRYRALVESYCVMAGFVPRIGFEHGNFSMQRGHLLLRKSVLIAPQSLLEVPDPELVVLPLEEEYAQRVVYLATWRNVRPSLAVQAFLTEARSRFDLPAAPASP